MPQPSAMTCLDTVIRLTACLGIVHWPSSMTFLGTVPRPSAMTCLDTVIRPSACLGTVPPPSSTACLDTVPRPSACLGTVPRPSACLGTVPRPSSMTCLDTVPRVTPSLMESPSLDHMGANDPMGAYIGRWKDSRDLERPPFSKRIRKVLEDSGEVHTCVEEYGRKETILDSSRDLL